jgi:pimeloyl-ACP methyl ester carboxylesterase
MRQVSLEHDFALWRHFKALGKFHRSVSVDRLEICPGMIASFAAPSGMKKPLDFDVASNPHNALLETEEPPMTTRRSFLHLSLGAVAASSTAVTLPHVAQGQGRTFKIKTRDGIRLFVKDTGGSGRAVVMTHAWPLSADIWDYQAAKLSSAGFRVVTYDRREGIKQGVQGDRRTYFGNLLRDVFLDARRPATNAVTPELVEALLAMAMQAGAAATVACVDAFARTDFRPELAAVKVPTLVLHGTADIPVPFAIGKATAEGIDQARLIEYPDASHGLVLTERDRVTRDLHAFIAS